MNVRKAQIGDSGLCGWML